MLPYLVFSWGSTLDYRGYKLSMIIGDTGCDRVVFILPASCHCSSWNHTPPSEYAVTVLVREWATIEL